MWLNKLTLLHIFCLAAPIVDVDFEVWNEGSQQLEQASPHNRCSVIIHYEQLKLSNYHHSNNENDDIQECPVASSFQQCQTMYHKLLKVFQEELLVVIHPPSDLSQHSTQWIHQAYVSNREKVTNECDIFIFGKVKQDRSCLLSPVVEAVVPTLVDVSIHGIDQIISKINKICHTFRDSRGYLTTAGLHHAAITNNLFSVADLSNSKTSYELFQQHKGLKGTDMPRCERVSVHSWQHFFHDYLQWSKPVIITDAIKDWPAIKLWTQHYFRSQYGNRSVHIKLSPTSDYEGIESAYLWDNYDSFQIPVEVKSKLLYPDLVVPRPAPVNMNFSEFLDLMEKIGNGSVKDISAYLEYSSISQYFPEMQRDILELHFVHNKLKLHHLNLWLSDGNTLGKLHFDPYDNLLCQLDGKKEVVLFEPHNNEKMYEAHIPEAEYSFNKKTFEFRRRRLMESTSMVMSPVDIKKPDFERFPKFKNAMPFNCTISQGDVLFMPAFWWHEVQSHPNETTNRNMAVNFWYEPFLNKEFPCPECRLDVNPYYHDIL